MEDNSKISIAKFNGTNFALWRMQIEDLLYLKKLFLPLGGIDQKPEKMSKEDWLVLDRTALSVIRLSLDPKVLFNIADETSTAGLMAALASMYEKPSAANKVYLMKQLFNLKMKDNDSVAAHLNEFNTVTSQLNSVGIKIDDEMRALIVLSSLPKSYDGLVTAVSNSCGSSPLKCDHVIGLILGEEVRRKSNGDTSGLETTMLVAGRGRNSDKSSDRKRGKSKARRSRGECWNCGQEGHFRRDCPNPEKGANAEASSVNLNVEYLQDALVLATQNPKSWIVDSGASCHATASRYNFFNYVTGSMEKLRLANNELCRVAGIGDVDIRLSNGSTLRLRGVRHVPCLKWNLISVRQLADDDCVTTFTKVGWKITKGSLVMARGGVEGSVFSTAGGTDGGAFRSHQRRKLANGEEVRVRFSGVGEAVSTDMLSHAYDGAQGDHVDTMAATNVHIAGNEKLAMMSSQSEVRPPTSWCLFITHKGEQGYDGTPGIKVQSQWELAMCGKVHSSAIAQDKLLARLHFGERVLTKEVQERKYEHSGVRQHGVGTTSQMVAAEVVPRVEITKHRLGQAQELWSLKECAARLPETVFMEGILCGGPESGATSVTLQE